LKDRYVIKTKEGIFQIEKANGDDSGIYTCTKDNVVKTFKVSGEILKETAHVLLTDFLFPFLAQIYLKFPENIYGVESERQEMFCEVKAGADPEITWRFRK